jgi:hypothetical protein
VQSNAIMGDKIDLRSGDGRQMEPTPSQSSKRQLSSVGLTNQPFNEWRPHQMKTGLMNHPIGRKASIIGLPILGYNGAPSQPENARGTLVSDQSRPVAHGKLSVYRERDEGNR